MKVFNLYLTSLILLLSIGMSGCGSKKKVANSAVQEEYPKDKVEELGLVLNGDSDTGKAGGIRTVYFAYDSSSLSEGAKAVLENNAKFMKDNGSVKVEIEGHADERGGVQYNLALGQRRANSVKNYLKALGVSAGRMSTVTYGKERPIEFGHNESAWSKNRRANFVITAK